MRLAFINLFFLGRRGRQRVRANLLANVLGARHKVGENEGQLHINVNTFSKFGEKVIQMVSSYWKKTTQVGY